MCVCVRVCLCYRRKHFPSPHVSPLVTVSSVLGMREVFLFRPLRLMLIHMHPLPWPQVSRFPERLRATGVQSNSGTLLPAHGAELYLVAPPVEQRWRTSQNSVPPSGRVTRTCGDSFFPSTCLPAPWFHSRCHLAMEKKSWVWIPSMWVLFGRPLHWHHQTPKIKKPMLEYRDFKPHPARLPLSPSPCPLFEADTVNTGPSSTGTGSTDVLDPSVELNRKKSCAWMDTQLRILVKHAAMSQGSPKPCVLVAARKKEKHLNKNTII